MTTPINEALYNAAVTSAGFGPVSSTASRIPSIANSTNATVAKASPGWLRHVNLYNVSGGVIYLKFYDKATAPTVGTDTPVLTVALQSTAVLNLPLTFRFNTGIAYGLTTVAADDGTTAPSVGAVLGLNVVYS